MLMQPQVTTQSTIDMCLLDHEIAVHKQKQDQNSPNTESASTKQPTPKINNLKASSCLDSKIGQALILLLLYRPLANWNLIDRYSQPGNRAGSTVRKKTSIAEWTWNDWGHRLNNQRCRLVELPQRLECPHWSTARRFVPGPMSSERKRWVRRPGQERGLWSWHLLMTHKKQHMELTLHTHTLLSTHRLTSTHTVPILTHTDPNIKHINLMHDTHCLNTQTEHITHTHIITLSLTSNT